MHPTPPSTVPHPSFPATDLRSTIVEDDDDTTPAGPVGSTLSPSLLRDLRRFGSDDASVDLLPAVAAAVRHVRPLRLRLDLDGLGLTVAIRPRQQVFLADLDLSGLTPAQFAALRLVQVEPDLAADPRGTAAEGRVGALRPLLWQLARHGARAELLPEIDGPVRYRAAAGVSLGGLPLERAWLAPLQALRAAPCTFAELQLLGALPRESVQRLLNALYLQSGLMITRTFPRRSG